MVETGHEKSLDSCVTKCRWASIDLFQILHELERNYYCANPRDFRICMLPHSTHSHFRIGYTLLYCSLHVTLHICYSYKFKTRSSTSKKYNFFIVTLYFSSLETKLQCLWDICRGISRGWDILYLFSGWSWWFWMSVCWWSEICKV